ncbi:MAG: transglycosylase domain-containing protein [Actinomycetota bacterium]
MARTPSKDYVPRHAPVKVAAKAGKKAGKKRSFLRRRWWVFVLVTPVVLGIVGFVALYVAYTRIQLPDKLPPIQTTYLYDRNGHLLTTLHGAVNRTIVPLSAISPKLQDAVIATEDHGFYEHPGIDPIGIARAAFTDLIKRQTVQGASTITEQLVKNVYAGQYQTDPKTGVTTYVMPPRTIKEKIREALLAVKLDRQLGKDWILAQYLNTVYFGHGAYGIEAAAETYFGKHASQLTWVESASLAGVLHAPTLYDPIDHPSDNWYRRNYALDQLAHYGYLDTATAAKLKATKCCGTVKNDPTERIVAPGDAEYFVDYTRQYLIHKYGEARVYGGGLRVTTSLDLKLQKAAEAAIARELPDPVHDPAAALVSIDPRTGQIVAMAGGRDWSKSKFNYATMQGGSGRQSGSAFKAFTLAAAMQNGYDLNAYWNGPSTITIPQCPDSTQPDGYWHVVNAGDGEAGTFTLAGATAHSVNTIFAQVIAQLGPDKVVAMAHALGIRSSLPETCAITVGSVAVNPLEMTNAYATLADQGMRHWATPLVQVKTPSNHTDPSVTEKGTQVLGTNDAELVTYALQGVVTGGTGYLAAIPPYPVAGKTGTANDNVDAWFCGYTVQLTTCVWMGWPKNDTTPLANIEGVPSVYGGTIPAAIWHDYMAVAMQGKHPAAFPTPSFAGYTVGPASPVASPTPSPTATPTPTSSPSPTKSPTPSPTPTSTPTPSPTDTPSPTGSPSPTSSPKPTKQPARHKAPARR